jgi:hypothetical protein
MNLGTFATKSVLSNTTMFKPLKEEEREVRIDIPERRYLRKKVEKVPNKKSGTYPPISTKRSKKHKQRKSGITNAFPSRLHDLLKVSTGNKRMRQVISWHPDGYSCFRVHNKVAFTRDIQPKYFKQSKYTSFRRQLNLWEFQRISDDDDTNGYYTHPSFLKHDRSRCFEMKRVKVKGESQTAVTKPKDTTASKQQESRRELIKTVSLSSVEEDCRMDAKDADMKVDDAITITKHTDEEDTSASSVHSLECTVVTANTDEQVDEQETEQEEALGRDRDLPEVSPQESYNFFLNALLFLDSTTC